MDLGQMAVHGPAVAAADELRVKQGDVGDPICGEASFDGDCREWREASTEPSIAVDAGFEHGETGLRCRGLVH
jgi:hypothetical protein